MISLPVCLSPWLESLDLWWLPLGQGIWSGNNGEKTKGEYKDGRGCGREDGSPEGQVLLTHPDPGTSEP